MTTDSSFMFPVDDSKNCNVLTLGENENTSLYVPVIPPTLFFNTSVNESYQRFEPKYLKYYIENCMRIGKIQRIDFAMREVPNFKTPQTCAFIHFDCLYDNENTQNMRDQLATNGKFKHFGFDNEDTFFKFAFYNQANSNAHLLFKINHKPIETPKEYSQNIEQEYAANKKLVETLQEKEEELRLLRADMKALTEEFSIFRNKYPEDIVEKNDTPLKLDDLM